MLVDADAAASAEVSPAARASSLSGRTPMARMTMSAGSARPLACGPEALPVLLEGRDSAAQVDAHVLRLQALPHRLGHLRIERWHELVRHLDDRHLETAAREVLRHLQADEAAADDDRAARLFLHHPISYPAAVGNGPQGEDARQVDSGKGRPDGRRAGGEHQRVV